MELTELLRTAAQVAATIVEAVGVLVVAVGVARAMVSYVVSLLVRRSTPFPPEDLRLDLARSLALALEFLLGADILRTAVDPSWEEITRLAAIAAIRTALNFFLERELEAAGAAGSRERREDGGRQRRDEGSPRSS